MRWRRKENHHLARYNDVSSLFSTDDFKRRIISLRFSQVKTSEVSVLHACDSYDADAPGNTDPAGEGDPITTRWQEASDSGLEPEPGPPGKGLVLVGDSNGALRLLSTPALASRSKATAVPNAHVGPVASCRFAPLPQRRVKSGNVTETTMAASLGKSGLVVALWMLTESTEATAQQIGEGSALSGRVPLLAVDDIGPLANPVFASSAGSSLSGAETLPPVAQGPKSLLCYVCGTPSTLSSYVAHVAKCSITFASIQRDATYARELLGVRALPVGPPTPANNAIAASGAARAAWATPLPVPPPPPGVHRTFLRSLPNCPPPEGLEGAPPAVSAAGDAKVLKALNDEQFAEANEDARKAFWEGNTLVRKSLDACS